MSNISEFPTSVDSFDPIGDVTINDIDNVNEYKELMRMNETQRDEHPNWQGRVDELSGLLEGKILTSGDIAKLQDAIIKMQEFILANMPYVSEIPPANPPTNKIWVDIS